MYWSLRWVFLSSLADASGLYILVPRLVARVIVADINIFVAIDLRWRCWCIVDDVDIYRDINIEANVDINIAIDLDIEPAIDFKCDDAADIDIYVAYY